MGEQTCKKGGGGGHRPAPPSIPPEEIRAVVITHRNRGAQVSPYLLCQIENPHPSDPCALASVPQLLRPSVALRAYCARRGRGTHPRISVTCLVVRRSSKAHMRTTKLPSTWYSTVPMNKPLSLVRYNYAGACKMHTCSSGKCHTRIYHQDDGHIVGNKNHHHFPPPQWLPPPLPTQTQAHEAKVHRVDT